jgi:hypothetical protein
MNKIKNRLNKFAADEEWTVETAWDKLLDLGVSEETLQVVTDINGYRLDVLEDVLYATQGYHSFDQLDD